MKRRSQMDQIQESLRLQQVYNKTPFFLRDLIYSFRGIHP